jgi:hypothetical protein
MRPQVPVERIWDYPYDSPMTQEPQLGSFVVVSITTSKVNFTLYDPVDKIILAKRVQHLMLLHFLETTRTKDFH